MNPILRRLLAELLAGLNVPGSMSLLGTADLPWRELRRLFQLHGWDTAEEIEQAISEWESQQKKV